MTTILEHHCANLESAIENLLTEYDQLNTLLSMQFSDKFHDAIRNLRQVRVGTYIKKDITPAEIYKDSFVEL